MGSCDAPQRAADGAPRSPKTGTRADEEVEHETHNAPWGQKTPPPGMRLAHLPEVAGPQVLVCSSLCLFVSYSLTLLLSYSPTLLLSYSPTFLRSCNFSLLQFFSLRICLSKSFSRARIDIHDDDTERHVRALRIIRDFRANGR